MKKLSQNKIKFIKSNTVGLELRGGHVALVNIENAANAYYNAAKEYHGDFAGMEIK